MAAGHFSAVQHFLLYGQREARAISPFIDLGKYLNANPIRMAGEDVKEGRKRQNANAAAIVTGLFA